MMMIRFSNRKILNIAIHIVFKPCLEVLAKVDYIYSRGGPFCYFVLLPAGPGRAAFVSDRVAVSIAAQAGS